MFEVNFILIKAPKELSQKKIPLNKKYASRIPHACATQSHLSLTTLSVRSVRALVIMKNILHYDTDNNCILVQKMI